MKIRENLQKILPFGYLFLVVLGVLKESVFYYQIGLNILKYSTIMDILISPIADLTAHPIVLVVLILFGLLLFGLIKLLSKNHHKPWVKKILNSKKPHSNLTEEEVENYFGKLFVIALSMGFLSFFLGIGLGNGSKVASRISSNSLKYEEKITFSTGESKEVYLIGSNSANYFYIEKGNNNNVRISPVGAVKSLEFLKVKTK